MYIYIHIYIYIDTYIFAQAHSSFTLRLHAGSMNSAQPVVQSQDRWCHPSLYIASAHIVPKTPLGLALLIHTYVYVICTCRYIYIYTYVYDLYVYAQNIFGIVWINELGLSFLTSQYPIFFWMQWQRLWDTAARAPVRSKVVDWKSTFEVSRMGWRETSQEAPRFESINHFESVDVENLPAKVHRLLRHLWPVAHAPGLFMVTTTGRWLGSNKWSLGRFLENFTWMCFPKLVDESWGMWNPIKQTFWVWWMVPGTSHIGFPGAWCPPFSHRTGAHQPSRQAVHSSLWWGNHQLWASWRGEASEDHRFNGWRLEDPINLTDLTKHISLGPALGTSPDPAWGTASWAFQDIWVARPLRILKSRRRSCHSARDSRMPIWDASPTARLRLFGHYHIRILEYKKSLVCPSLFHRSLAEIVRLQSCPISHSILVCPCETIDSLQQRLLRCGTPNNKPERMSIKWPASWGCLICLRNPGLMKLKSWFMVSLWQTWQCSPFIDHFPMNSAIKKGCLHRNAAILQLGVSENSVPLKPLVNDHYPY